MSRPTNSARLIPILVLVVCGCSEQADSGAARIVSDSAGVEVVSIRPAEATRRWSAAIATEIGVLSGPEEFEFRDVAGALQLADGKILVADEGSKELRFFDSSGSFLIAVGGEGEGPGEYRSFDFLGLLGDTIVVYDGRLHRLSFHDMGGLFHRSVNLRTVILPYVVGVLEPGLLVAWQFTGPDQEGLGIHTGRMEFGTISLPEGGLQVFGVANAAEEAQVNYRGSASRAFRPFSREGDVAAGGSHIYVLDSSSDNRILVFDTAGRLARLIAIDYRRHAPTPEDVNRWVESWMEEFQPPSQDVEDWWRFGFREVPPPDSIPLIRSLEVDTDGNVCAERYPETWDSPSRYWCFSPQGYFIRSIQLPAGQIRRGPHPYWDPRLQISDRHVVGVWADELGIERIRVFELKSGSSTSESNGA